MILFTSKLPIMKLQKDSIYSLLLVVFSLVAFNIKGLAQEAKVSPLEKWLGTWEVELYKIEPDTMMKYSGYTRPNILEMNWSVDSLSVIQTFSRYYQGQWIKSVTLLVHDFEKKRNNWFRFIWHGD